MWRVWLVWILTTKHKSMKRVENFERCVIFSCYYLLILLIKRFLFCCVHLLFRFILQMVLLYGYLSLSICSALNPDCSFVFEWHNLLGIWNDAQIFLWGVYLCVHTVLTTEGVIIPFDLHWVAWLGNPFGILQNSVINPITDLLNSGIFIRILFFQS
jgi:hypothetical protein